MNALQDLFITVLNMSITASYVAVGVILARFVLSKAPKIYSYALWAVVLFRLICPSSFTSAFSFLGLVSMDSQNSPGGMEYVPYDIGLRQAPTLQSGIGSLDSTVNSSLPQATPFASANPLQIWIDILSLIWLVGILVLLAYSIISYLKIKRRLQTATLVKENIYESDQIGTAFVFGFIQPKIYLPLSVEETDLSYILEHERTHIRRRDYLIKPLAFLALVLHWFNPLMWLSFMLMSRDMEMSCDESVLRRMGEGAKGAYSRSLLSLSAKKIGHLTANPLAFGESHVKARIKNTLNYRKPGFWVLIISAIAVAGIGIALMSNPVDSKSDLSLLNPHNIPSLIVEQEQILIESNNYGNTEVSGVELGQWLDSAANSWKRKNVSSPYELSPSITIHVNDDLGHEIRFFDSEPTLAMILYEDQYRYYKIPEEDYYAIKEAAELGYPNVQSLTITQHEGGANVATVIITDSTSIMRMALLVVQGENTRPSLLADSSLTDTPPVSDYIRVDMEGKETHSYFIYTDDKEYYIEKPYVRINEIGLDTFNEISTIFTNAGIGLPGQFTQDAAELQKRVDSGEAELQALLDPMSSAALILGLNGGYFSSEPLSTSPLKLEYNWDYQKAEIEMYQPIKTGDGGIWLVKSHDIIDVQPGREIVERNLAVIMSSPQTSSNPQDYIREHPNEYENILKGGEDALTYMLSQFENGNADGLREQIMMRLCKELLGVRNNVTDEALSPQQWYAALSIQQETKLPDFAYDGDDPIEKLVYSTEVERNSQPERGFTIVAPKIFGSYEEGDLLKVFVTTYSTTYTLYNNVLEVVSGGVIPSAITYKKDDKGNYVLYDYEQAQDGSYFAPSIRDFCTMPMSNKEISGLADEILNHYGDYEDISVLQRENLFKHLRANGITDATLTNSYGEIEFSMSSQ